MGRPSKYNPKYHIPWVKSLAMDGKTEHEIADSMEISRSTLKKWEKDYPEFAEALAIGKGAADAAVEQSLFKRAMGFKYKEKKTIITMDKDGNQMPARIESIEREAIPDTGACIFWLKNRRRDRWRDSWDVDVTTDKEINFNIVPASKREESEGSEETEE